MTVTKQQLEAVKAGKKPPAKKKVAKKKTKKKAAKKTNGSKVISKPKVIHRLFAEALIKNEMNATAAYKEVKPSVTDKTAAAEGHKLLRKPETVTELIPRVEKLFIKAGIESEYVFRRWLEIATGSPLDYFHIREDGYLGGLDLTNLTPAQRNNLKSISISDTKYGQNVRVEVYDAQKAVDTIGKHLGLLVDKLADEDVERIGDMIEKGVARIKANKDLDGWKDLITEGEFKEVS